MAVFFEQVDIEKLEDSPHLLDILIQMEDVLDSLDCYVFKNWIDGEIVEGPKVRRYWLDMTLKFDYRKMPDPKAALRLLKHGVRVDYEKVHVDDKGEEVAGQDKETHSALSLKHALSKATTKNEDAAEEDEDSEEDTKNLVWLVRVSIPRRLVTDINAGQLDFYDEEVDVDDVEDAQDSGLNDESGYTDPSQGGDPMGGAGDPMADPMNTPSGAGAAPGGAPAPGGPK